MTRREFLKWMARGLAVAWLAPRVLVARQPGPSRKERPQGARQAPRFWLEGRPGRCATVEEMPLWPDP